MHDKPGFPCFSPADMKMRDMDLMTGCHLLKKIMVAGRNGVMDVILCRDKEDFHNANPVSD
jgi:hypothetical protein